MAIQQITHKRITKFDTSNPNYKETPKPKQEVSGNVMEDEDVYGERNTPIHLNQMETYKWNR